MTHVFYYFGLVFSLLNQCKLQSHRIVGGKNAESNQFPFFAQLKMDFYKNGTMWSSSCGATLIHPQWLLSAGHCFPTSIKDRQKAERDQSMTVYMGTNKKFGPDALLNVITSLHVHPKFFSVISNKGSYTVNDIAVAKLKFPYDIQYIQLPKTSIRSRCQTGTIIGTGSTNLYSVQFSSYVQYAEVKLIRYVGYNVFYSETPTWEGHAYLGDSGGPYVCYFGDDAVQYGVMSFVNYNNKTLITGYAAVDEHLAFIMTSISNGRSIKPSNLHLYCLILRSLYKFIEKTLT